MKRSIYVVDDEEPVLKLTVLILRNLGHDWEVTGFLDAFAALETIKAKAPDAVLTDQRMPGLSGGQLLEKVRADSPATIRLAMSGSVPHDKPMLITSAHEWIAKPFEPARLLKLVQRAFAAKERFMNRGLWSAVSSFPSVPSLPPAHLSLLEGLKEARSNTSILGRTVSDDALGLLQLANSAPFALDSLVTNPFEAANDPGIDMIIAVLLAQPVFQHYESLPQGGLDLPRVWAHCRETGELARHLCREKQLPWKTGDSAFLAGLLHELGRFVMIENYPEQFQAASENARQANKPLAVCLRQAFHVSPAQMSAYVLELWGLPSAVIDSLLLLDDPEKDLTPGFSMTSALYIADHIAAQAFPPDPFPLEDWNRSYLQSIGCADEIPIWGSSPWTWRKRLPARAPIESNANRTASTNTPVPHCDRPASQLIC